nr:glycerate kinase [Nesterenkonia sp. Act20]
MRRVHREHLFGVSIGSTGPRRVVCVPDSFKGSASASEAATAMARGVRQVFAEAEVLQLPFADGGEGTLDALLAAWGRTAESVEVFDAIGRPVTARYGRSSDGRIGVIEAAQANGLPQVADQPLQPLRADSWGVGLIARELLADPHCEEILLCIGGSATTDGGTGLLGALGVRFLDEEAQPVRPGGEGLARIAAIDTAELDPRARAVRWRIAVDVENPLTGPRGAAAVFGPQKGATAEQVQLLDTGLENLAGSLATLGELDPQQLQTAPGFGAAGGMPVSLSVLLGAEILPGAQMVAEAVGLEAALAQADLVLTGEGSLDTQSLDGKVVHAVRRYAPASAAVVVIAGAVQLSPAQCRAAGLAGAFSIAAGPAGLDELLCRAPELIEDAAAQVCGLLQHSVGS